MRRILLIFYFLFLNLFNIDSKISDLGTIDIIEVNEINTNSTYIGVKSLFDGTNQLLIEQHPIGGINCLFDSVLSFFCVYTQNSLINDTLKIEINELIIKFKYQITILMNTYFKLYKTEVDFQLNNEQKKLISKKLNFIFENVINMIAFPSDLGSFLSIYFSEIFNIITILFSIESINSKNFVSKESDLNDAISTYKLLLAKFNSLNFNIQKKNPQYHKELLSGFCQIFNNSINLSIQSNSNFEYTKENISGLLKIILVLFPDTK